MFTNSSSITNPGKKITFPGSTLMMINSKGIQTNVGSISVNQPSSLFINSNTIQASSEQLFPSQTSGVTISGNVQGTLPGAPTIASVTPLVGSASIVFQVPSDNGGSTITQYTGYAYLNGTGPSVATGIWTTGRLQINITGLTSSSQYSFRISATNSSGEGPLSTPSALLTIN